MIFFFSATGNTAWAAKQLGFYTSDRLINIVKNSAEPFIAQLEPGEDIGFCFPIHGWRPPRIVADFVKQLVIDATGHYVYALCTAGDTVGEAMDIFRHELSEKGITLDAAFSLLMPESYVGLPFMDVDKKEREKAKQDKAAEDLKEFAQLIEQHQKHVERLTIGHWPRINSRILGAAFCHWLITDKPFRVVSDRCVKCGICASVCPVHDIDGGLGKEPRWIHNGQCMTCFACYHHCPHHAIEFGNRTKHKGQYFFGRRKL